MAPAPAGPAPYGPGTTTAAGRPGQGGPPARRSERRTGLSVLLAVVVVLLAVLVLVLVNQMVGELSVAGPDVGSSPGAGSGSP
jgi:hypothetical protein